MSATLNSPSATPALVLTGISKHFETLEVLRDISVQIARGEILALLGASGCGKTTLLSIIAGLLPADSGTLRFFGEAASDFQDWRRIAYMFQEDRLLPWRTSVANVALGLEADPMGKAERLAKADAALRLVELAGFAAAWPHQLSGGMRSRVALARSLVMEPRILLMDEPFSTLDPQTRAQMHRELLRVHGLKGMTVVFVTHDVEEAVVLADRVVLLEPRPARIRAIEDIELPRPRVTTDLAVSERIRQLRLEA